MKTEGNGKLMQEIAELVKVHSRELEVHRQELVELKAQTKAIAGRNEESREESRRERAEDRRRWQRLFRDHEKFLRHLDRRLDLHYRLIQRRLG